MAQRKKVLGRGLEALFTNLGSDVINEETGTSLHEISVSLIEPNPFQPRQEFKPEEIEELGHSIRSKGLLQPILVRKHGARFQIVAGERRFRATQFIGKTKILAHVRDRLSDRDMMEMALIENLQRVQLNPIEEGLAFQRLINECGLTHEDMAQRLGKSRASVTNTMRLLKLDPRVQAFIEEGKISAGHARALLQEPPERQIALAQKIIKENLNVRAAEKISKKGSKRPPVKLDANLLRFSENLQYAVGTRVHIRGTSRKGVLEISYSSQEELERLGKLLEKTVDS